MTLKGTAKDRYSAVAQVSIFSSCLLRAYVLHCSGHMLIRQGRQQLTCSGEMDAGSWMPFREVLSRCMNRQKLLQSRLALMSLGLTSCQMALKGTLQPDLACSGCAELADTPPLSTNPCVTGSPAQRMSCACRASSML